MNSGLIWKPPVRLKVDCCGNSTESGMPAAKKASSGRPTIKPSDVQNTGNCWPVAIWRWRARRATNQLMAMASTKASAISHDPLSQTSFGRKKPRLFK